MMLRRNNQKGFSLIELIMVIVILSIISVVISRFLSAAYQTFLTSEKISNTDYNGYFALEKMTNDIHTIRSPSDISTMSTSQFSFTNMNGASVQYQLSGTTLLRNSLTVASGVQSLTLTYYDQNYAVTATPANVSYISISATLAQSNISTTFSTLVGTRGLS